MDSSANAQTTITIIGKINYAGQVCPEGHDIDKQLSFNSSLNVWYDIIRWRLRLRYNCRVMSEGRI
jgi:hypothetical protein